MRPGRLDAGQWSNYWQGGTFHSLPGLFPENYAGAVSRFWHTVFSRLPAGARVLDLGTGNGALALLAGRYAEENGLEFGVTGIDSAIVDPPGQVPDAWKPLAGKITFLSPRRMEQTGLPGAHFHLVMSQFAFEYAEREKAVAELARLLHPRGLFAAVLHHERSKVVQQAAQLLRQMDLCDHSGLLPLTRRILELQAAAPGEKGKAELAGCARKFNETMQALLPADRQFADPAHLRGFRQSLGSLLDAKSGPTETRLRRLAQFERETRLYRLRLQDLQSAALSSDQLQALRRQLAEKGLVTTRLMPLFHGDAFLAFTLQAQYGSPGTGE